MQRSILLTAACLAVLAAAECGRAEDAPTQREDIARGLEMYRWLIDHEEFAAAEKLVAEIAATHPDDPQVRLIVENAQLRAAVREASRLLGEEPPACRPAAAGTPEELIHPASWDALVQPRASNRARLLSAVAGEEPTAVARELGVALNQPVSLHFEDAPLQDVLRHIAETQVVNIVVDDISLAEKGLTSETPVSIDVDGITLDSALNLLLGPLDLGHTAEDEVIKITSRSRLSADVITRVYSVADLVTPLRHVNSGPEPAGPESPETSANLDALIELITTTVQPESWASSGGEGHVEPHHETLSLVIQQTIGAHEEIAGLLSGLRHNDDVQAVHSLHLLSVPRSEIAAIGLTRNQPRVLAGNEYWRLQDALRGVIRHDWPSVTLPRVTLRNRQAVTLQQEPLADSPLILLSSTVSDDLCAVHVHVSAPGSLTAGDVLGAAQSALIPDGATALFVVSDARWPTAETVPVLAVTTRIVVEEEEEVLLGLPTPAP